MTATLYLLILVTALAGYHAYVPDTPLPARRLCWLIAWACILVAFYLTLRPVFA